MRQALLMALVADGLLSIMDAVIKGLTARYPTFQIAFLRFAMGGIGAVLVFAYMRPGWPSRASATANLTRSVLVTLTAMSFFYALAKLPLAEAIALSFLSPLFIAAFGALLLGEALGARLIMALGVGFAGMLVMMSGQLGGGNYSDAALLGIAAALFSALTYALNVIVLRVRAQTDPVPTIILFQHLGPMCFLALPAWSVWVGVSSSDLLLFALIGAIGIAGHMLLAMAFARAPASALAPVIYTALVWAVVLGYVVYGEVPTASVLGGALLIVVATVLTSGRKQKAK
jgi:S-adenosylmethionine uptake transporter